MRIANDEKMLPKKNVGIRRTKKPSTGRFSTVFVAIEQKTGFERMLSCFVDAYG
jgi:hypothetical protein